MRLLALDQSSRTTGYAIFEDGNLIAYDKFTYEDNDFGDRLLNIRNKIKSLIDTYLIDEVIFEDIQMQKNVDTFKKLAEVFGVVYELVTELNKPNVAVLATVWRSGLGIAGIDRTPAKKNTQLWVENTYSIKATQDECDAIGIGTYYFKKIYNQPKPFNWE